LRFSGWEVRLSRFFRSLVSSFVMVLLSCAAGAQSKASLDVSETLFSVIAAANVCGYDADLRSSLPIRLQVRADLMEAGRSPQAASAAGAMCAFYRDHRQNDAAHDLAQYVSLALNLGEPPDFSLRRNEADLPPDTAYVLGFVPLLKQYYTAAGLHSIWLKHELAYTALIDQYHAAVASTINSTDNYLRMPLSGYSGRSFTVYLEPMVGPGQVNARNYLQNEYYVVLSPRGNNLPLEGMRHTYLDFVVDPLIARRATALLRLKPVLRAVQTAPMAEDYRHDSGLLVVECLIRAIEARTPADPRLPEKSRLAMVRRDEAEGFVLTGYFYEQLRNFEKHAVGMQDAFPDWLHNLDVEHEAKRARGIQFSSQAAPEVIQASQRASQQKVDLAERELASGNPQRAEKLAQESLAAKEDTARAHFVLARVAAMRGETQRAQENFQKALAVAKDPRLAAWCHIYLGRILDLQEEREAAVAQYQAALKTGDTSMGVKRAAALGLKEPYHAPARKDEPQ
jgi:tetratricopeptide (TPR) repeat protein